MKPTVTKKVSIPELIPVQSSTLQAMAWRDEQLYIVFLGTPLYVYIYSGVPDKLWELFVSVGRANTVLVAHDAPTVSLGSLFHYLIKKPGVGLYPFEKIALANCEVGG